MKPNIARTARLLAIASGIALGAVAWNGAGSDPAPPSAITAQVDMERSANAFLKAYKVFMSPRCMNCHPKGDAPLQGDDSHVHGQGVLRGVDGHGNTAMKCASCHQAENVPGEHTPPGHPKWALPPANMKMVFEGRTATELAEQFKDQKQTGKTLDEMVKHVTEDTLVGKGWDPGEGRTKPPMSREEFAAAFKEWVDWGAATP